MKEQLHLIVTGKVQGVFYRKSLQNKALELGLIGWVRNTEDGNVEIVAEGERRELEQLMIWSRQGPQDASVLNVSHSWTPAQNEYTTFKIID